MVEDLRGRGIRGQRGATNLSLVWVVVALAVGFVVGMLVFKNGEKDDVVKPADDTVQGDVDVMAKKVRITYKSTAADTLHLDSLTVFLSKRGNERVQWQNDTDEPLIVEVVGAPIGEVIQPHKPSAPFQVCQFCTVNAKYDYVVRWKHGADWAQAPIDRPPTEPSIGVGD